MTVFLKSVYIIWRRMNKLILSLFTQVLHHCFFRYFHFITDFYYCWFHFITLASNVFISPLIFAIVFRLFLFHQFSLPLPFLLSGTSLLCCCFASDTDLTELLSLSGVFYVTFLPNIWHNLLLSRLPWESEVFPWG